MDQPTFSTEGGWVGSSGVVGGRGEVGFDVSPGWRRADHRGKKGGEDGVGAEECG